MKTSYLCLRLIDSRAVRVLFSRSFLGDWVLSVHFGRGAGYIGGTSLWIANAANSQFFGPRKSVRMYQRRFSFGATRNANRVPWCRG